MTTRRKVMWQDEAEKKQVIASAKEFDFDNIDNNITYGVLISGREGSGKTHLACTLAESGKPVYFLDTERKAHIVIRKFDGIKPKRVNSYTDLKVAILALTKRFEPGWVILDSATDMQGWAEADYLSITKMEKVYPLFNWSEVFGRCDYLLHMLRDKGFGWALTARMKDEYRADKPTGAKVPQIYKRVPYQADLALEFRDEKLFVTKNGFMKNLDKTDLQEMPRDVLLHQIIETLQKQAKEQE